MIAPGIHSLQNEIDTKKVILETLVERFPNILEEEIAHYETLLNEEAVTAAAGDKDIEMSYKQNSFYNNIIDFQSSILLLYYYSLTIMIYSFAETSLKQICDYAHLYNKQIRRNYIVEYYKQIKIKYDTLPALEELWKERASFQEIRNMITHQMKTQNQVATKAYLKNNLDEIYNMLCIVLSEVLTHK